MVKSARSAETWHLEDEAITPLLQALDLGGRRLYRKGECLYSQGAYNDRLFLILRGHVLISSTREDGTEFTMEIMGRRAVCGEAAAFDGGRCFTSAHAVDEVEVVAFEAATLITAFRDRPEIAVALLRITSRKQRIIAVRAHYLASLKPEARIAELLHRLAQQYGTAAARGVVIGVSLTHKQMASLTGTTRVTVTRVLKRLREHGDILLDDRRVIVPDMERLLQAVSRRV